MEVTFLNPEYLIFLLCIPLLVISHFLSMRFLRGKALKLSNFPAVERVVGKKTLSSNITILVLRCIVLFFLIFSVTGTTLWYEGKSTNNAYALAIDSSGSMLAQDFEPNRFEAAKSAAQEFVMTLQRSEVAVIAFSGTSLIQTELTTDKEQVAKDIASMQILPAGGTDIAQALVTSTNVLKNSDKALKIVLLTDGQNNVGSSLDDALAYVMKNQVTVHVIGMGSEEGGKVDGLTTLSRINEPELQRIATQTGGRYAMAKNAVEIASIYKDLSQIEKEKIPVHMQLPFLLLAILFVFIEWGLLNTRYRMLP